MKGTKEQNKKKMRAWTHGCAQNKGITLIALVITIIVMLILVAVTISMAVNGGLFDYAGKAVSETNNALKTEQQIADGGIEVDGVWYSSINEYLNKDKERISKTESYVGYYADVDGDGTADGVIYADLAIGGSGNWGYISYSYDPVIDVKDYYVSGTHNGDFGNGVEVLTATGEGKDRFYVMSLSDLTTADYSTFCWYYNAFENANTEVVTSNSFGTGKANTATMLEKWNNPAYGAQNARDLWAQIDVNSKWFLPSRDEWVAFSDAFDITIDNYGNFKLSGYYWTSSQDGAWGAWYADSNEAYVDYRNICYDGYVRLSMTF